MYLKGVGDMAFLNIPKGRSDFETIRREGFYYVDKTGLIGEILKSSGTQVTLITRPRRFGKTLGMSTLECFLDIQKDSQSLFDGLEISKQRNICDEWMNKWPEHITKKNYKLPRLWRRLLPCISKWYICWCWISGRFKQRTWRRQK